MLGASQPARRRTTLIRVAAAVAAAGLLASCSSAPLSNRERFSSSAYGVPASPRVAFGRHIPKGGGRYLVGEPYRVAGRTYVPRDYSHYSAKGLASWYGSAFHGRKTANGEVYDMADLTAAHPTLPLPSYVRVTNLANGRSVVVRVNDRGPYSRNRLIDVSATVAAMLDFKRKGTAQVKVDYVGPARMDGRDRKMLMASYRAPGALPADDFMLATARPAPMTPPGVILASAPVGPRARKPAPIDFGIADDQPVVLTPANARAKMPALMPAATDGDPLAPLILRTGFTSSYAPTDHFTPAVAAATRMAKANRPVATNVAALEQGLQAKTSRARVVQLGVFSDPANADRIADAFGRYGRVLVIDKASDNGTLKAVRVVVDDPAVPTDAVIAAAEQAGLRGAALVAR